MASQQTPNYRLSRWAGTDRILVEEFNDNRDKIDTALKASADNVASAAAALENCGNCDIGLFTYTGNGKYGSANPTTITFPKMPTVFIIKGTQGIMMGRGGESKGTISVQGSSNAIVQDLDLTWQGSKCSFYHTVTARQQMNASDTYWVLAFYQTKS